LKLQVLVCEMLTINHAMKELQLFSSAGHELVRHVARLVEVQGSELDTALAELDAAICPMKEGMMGLPNDAAVVAWFERMLPRCMALVPKHRRNSFLKGVYSYVRDEENIDTTY